VKKTNEMQFQHITRRERCVVEKKVGSGVLIGIKKYSSDHCFRLSPLPRAREAMLKPRRMPRSMILEDEQGMG
jgi:hypothetical protein